MWQLVGRYAAREPGRKNYVAVVQGCCYSTTWLRGGTGGEQCWKVTLIYLLQVSLGAQATATHGVQHM